VPPTTVPPATPSTTAPSTTVASTTAPPATVPGTTTAPAPPSATAPATSGNLALGKAISATGSADVYRPQNANDGNATTYWESTNSAFPQSVTVDLGTAQDIGLVVLALPPLASWGARTQTLSVSGSTDGRSFSTLAGPDRVRFDPATGNSAAVTVEAGSQRYVRVTVTANTGWPGAQLSELAVYRPGDTPPGPPPGARDLAGKRPATVSSHTDVFGAASLTDGNPYSYWESTNNVFPQWAQVDLGSTVPVRRVVLTLPPLPAWQARSQTLSLSGSTDGSSFSTIAGAATHRFDPAGGNTATIAFAATERRWLRVSITANTGWPAGQLSSLQVYGS
jgi:hypothetical protein